MNQRELNREYFYTYEWQNVTYKGLALYKYPADLLTYQQIIYENKPNVIIETGTCKGGSALFFYDTMVSCGIENPLVITCDIRRSEPKKLQDVPGIVYIKGSSLENGTLKTIKYYLKNKKVMVSLDSDHIKDHVLAELNIYNNFVTKDQYIVVEDTFLGEYGVFETEAEERFRPDKGQTPKDAVNIFLKNNKEFIIDKTRNKIISMNPNGYLKKC